ncbi:hypothetical protein ABW19_dt0203729 [Dactylella cylindrospora]|nr:hypothetical protein ABW19_dt0203729 [Dactylella cylindrospora]
MSPRRSSRARSTAHNGNSHPSSSHSSSSSTRRSRNKTRYGSESAHGLNRADSYDEADEAVDEEMEDNYSGNEEDEGETRCVCGFKEYQGGSDDSHTDLTDGLFIQCDQCHVWQHGLCVGIRDKALAPDNYFCEQCKPENHTLYEKKGGRTYSTYIGFGPERLDVSKDHPTKRRSTMNSRDAAYDEQILNQVIEQSKLDDRKSTGTRSRKRGTSETSDEHHSKRQRTSDSPEKIELSHGNEDSTDKGSSSRKSRNGRTATSATPTLPSTQSNSKRSSGRSRAEKDNRRDGTDTPTQVTLVTHADIIAESEQSEEPPRSTRNTATATKAEETLPVALTPSIEVPETPSLAKRSSRQRRRGNNRNANRTSEDPGEHSSHAMARDASAQGTDANGVHDRPAKPRLPNSRTTIQEMRRRVNGISDFIVKTQLEMVNQKQRTQVFGALVSATSTGGLNTEVLFSLLDHNKSPNSSTSTPTPGVIDKVTVVTDRPEADAVPPSTQSMSSTELMDFLMKKVNHWELTYNKQTERVH